MKRLASKGRRTERQAKEGSYHVGKIKENVSWLPRGVKGFETGDKKARRSSGMGLYSLPSVV